MKAAAASATCNGILPATARDAFLYYARRGLRCVPQPYGDAGCFLKGWPDLRLDAADVDEHFPEGEARNIGLLTGSTSGNVLDVDLDCPLAVKAAPLFLPPTGWRFCRSSRERAHWLYRTDRPARYKSYDDPEGGGIVELKGNGGKVTVPPSKHAKTGELLTWEEFAEPALVDLLDIHRDVGRLAAAVLLASRWPDDGRHTLAIALTGMLMTRGWSADEAADFVEKVADLAGDEKASKRARIAENTADRLDEGREVRGAPTLAKLLGDKVVACVLEWLGLDNPRPPATSGPRVRLPDPYRNFPAEKLPGPLGRFAVEAADAIGCPRAYVGLPLLAAVAGAIGNTRVIRLKRGWVEPSVVWTAVVGESGTQKSPALDAVLAPVRATQAHLHSAYKQERENYDQAKADKQPLPMKPVFGRVLVKDITIEKLVEVLEDNPRGVLAARDELAGWISGFTRYKGKQGGSDLQHWLEIHRAGCVIYDRKTGDRPSLYVPRAAVSVTGTIQPGTLKRALSAEYIESGFAARIVLAYPPRRLKRWSEVEVSPDTQNAYHDLMGRLYGLKMELKDGVPAPRLLKLSPEAKEVFTAFYEEWAAEQNALIGELAAAFAKLEGYCARFALLHHVVVHAARDEDDDTPVGPDSVEFGAMLCRWFGYEARRVYTLFVETEEDQALRQRYEFVQARGGRISVRDYQRSHSGRYAGDGGAEAARADLDALVKAGLAVWEQGR